MDHPVYALSQWQPVFIYNVMQVLIGRAQTQNDPSIFQSKIAPVYASVYGLSQWEPAYAERIHRMIRVMGGNNFGLISVIPHFFVKILKHHC